MKKRLISAIIVIGLAIPIFIRGGKLFNLTFYVLAILGLKEFLEARAKSKKYPDFMRLISYIMLTLVYFENILNSSLTFIVDYRLIASLFLILLIPVVLYHDNKLYNVSDAFYLLGFVFFLGFSMSLFNMYRNMGLAIIIFLFLITIITDTYAYFTGSLIGRHKLLENISPNKTWEGTIGGSLIATFICTTYYFTIINQNESVLKIGLIVLFLTLIGQFGDLFFSAIKRKYEIKDFSNIMPGHGGILDRLDSIIFVMLTFTFFIGII